MPGYITKIRPLGDDQHTDIRNNPLAHGKRLLLFYLQELFREPNPTGLIYMEDDKESQILIKGAYGKNQETFNKKPLVVVNRSGAQVQSRTLGSIEHVDYRTGGYTRTELVPFSLTARILSNNEYAAEKIAWFIVSASFTLRHVLIRQGFYHVGNQFTISPPQQPVATIPADQAGAVMIELSLPCSHLMTSRYVPLNNPVLSDVSTTIKDAATGQTLLPDESSQD